MSVATPYPHSLTAMQQAKQVTGDTVACVEVFGQI